MLDEVIKQSYDIKVMLQGHGYGDHFVLSSAIMFYISNNVHVTKIDIQSINLLNLLTNEVILFTNFFFLVTFEICAILNRILFTNYISLGI